MFWRRRLYMMFNTIIDHRTLSSQTTLWFDICTVVVVVVQSLSRVQLFGTQWTAARQASLSITNSRNLPKPMSIESVMPSKHLLLCHPLLLLPSVFPSIRFFSNESVFSSSASGGQSIGVSASTSVPPNEYPGLISFRMDSLDLLAVQRTLESFLQHHS